MVDARIDGRRKVLVVAGGLVDWLIWRVGDAPDDAARRAAMRVVGVAAEAATALGAIVVLLTAAAQGVA